MYTSLRVTTQFRPIEPTFVHVNKVNAVSCGNVHVESTGIIGCWHVIKLSIGVQSTPNAHRAESLSVSRGHPKNSRWTSFYELSWCLFLIAL